MFLSHNDSQCKRIVPNVFAETIKADRYNWLIRRYNEMHLIHNACMRYRRHKIEMDGVCESFTNVMKHYIES